MNDLNQKCQQAVAQHNAGNIDGAVTVYEQILSEDSNHLDACVNMGFALCQLGRLEESIQYLENALTLCSDNAQIYFLYGNALYNLNRVQDAEVNFQKAVELNPQYFDAWHNLGNALRALGKNDEAIEAYKKVLEINNQFFQSYYGIGNIYDDRKDHIAAIENYKKALDINPQFYPSIPALLKLNMDICAWQEVEKYSSLTSELADMALAKGLAPLETPFMSILKSMDMARNYKIAKAVGDHLEQQANIRSLNFEFSKDKKDKIKVGYVSSDFQNHPGGYTVSSLLSKHDKDKFEIYIYSLAHAGNKSENRKNIKQWCHKFVDLDEIGVADAAKMIHDDGIDILIDRNGHTASNRFDIFAFKPAPIQVEYMGYPSTSGASFMDYIITDKICVPEEDTKYCSEKLAYLHQGWHANLDIMKASDRKFTRKELDLPEEGIIFCCFNQSYKIDATMFSVWMKILQKVENSVMWIYKSNDLMIGNLRKEAEKRGIDGNRIIFAERVRKEDHLARLKIVDIALDTRVYTSHTIAADSLTVGIPTITCKGTHWASRGCTSHLVAAGMDELVTESLEEFEKLAVEIATDGERLARIKNKIIDNQKTAPLYDTQLYLDHLESLLEQMYEIYINGEDPRQIETKIN